MGDCPNFKHVDLSHITGRILIVGDVHGEFDLLRACLKDMNYDAARDRIVFLGDLTDRGPLSLEAIAWANQIRVRGNHEDLLHRAVVQRRKADKDRLIAGGGKWAYSLSPRNRRRHAKALNNAPVALEITTPGGRTIGCVHAAVPDNDWGALRDTLLSGKQKRQREAIKHAIWNRDAAKSAKLGLYTQTVANIDHVFFGHTQMPYPVQQGNCSWLDTGAYKTGVLTVIDADQWLDMIEVERQTPVKLAA